MMFVASGRLDEVGGNITLAVTLAALCVAFGLLVAFVRSQRRR